MVLILPLQLVFPAHTFRYLMNHLFVFEVNLELRLVSLIRIAASCEEEGQNLLIHGHHHLLLKSIAQCVTTTHLQLLCDVWIMSNWIPNWLIPDDQILSDWTPSDWIQSDNLKWLNPKWLNPMRLNPKWLNPIWLNPKWLNPKWLNPKWLNPE